jgi:hypothetical protein
VPGSNTIPSGSTAVSQILADGAGKALERVVEPAEEIHVFRRSRQRRLPDVKHAGTFENEALAIRRDRKAVEETLHGVVLQQLLKRPLFGASPVLKTGMHGRREILDCHNTAST